MSLVVLRDLFANTPTEGVVVITSLAAQCGTQGNKRSLSRLQWVKIMRRLLKGDFGMDVQFAMTPQFDLNNELDVPEDILKS